MITDDQLNALSVFLGSLAVLLIVVYHFLEVNAKPEVHGSATSSAAGGVANKS